MSDKPQPPQPTIPNGPHLLKIVAMLQKDMESRLEMMNHQSQMLRTRYNFLLDKGFDNQQALYLCTQDWGQAL